jgi:hypothetical protein
MDFETRVLTLMEDHGLTEEEAKAEIGEEDRIDAQLLKKGDVLVSTEDEPDVFVSTNGDIFEELFTPIPSFSFLNVSDEVHDPGDTLEKYSKVFQENVKLLRAEEDPNKLAQKGQTAYANRHRMTTKEWNFWSVEYRLKKNRLIVITEKGEKAGNQLRNTLGQMSEEGVRAYGRELHKLCDRSNGESALQKIGLNTAEINNLWTIWREFSGQRSENEGIDFIIE